MGKRYQAGSVVPDFDFVTPWDGEKNFYAVGAGKKKVLFFLRYYGCRTTQLEFRDIVAEQGKFYEKNAQVYVVLQSAAETLRSQTKKENVGFEIVCDPEGTLYRLFDIGYLHLGYFLRGIPSGTPPRPKKFEEKLEKRLAQAAELGIVHGAYEGSEQQLPAVFIVGEDQKMIFVHYAEDIIDIPEADDLLKYL
ncbi:MAG: redoxin domain-containing protein [Synergistaceae bacterium]|jgi:peroxiredoxin|nr:redoxin domain-containing protein [Synergistaceae bacterium]